MGIGDVARDEARVRGAVSEGEGSTNATATDAARAAGAVADIPGARDIGIAPRIAAGEHLAGYDGREKFESVKRVLETASKGSAALTGEKIGEILHAVVDEVEYAKSDMDDIIKLNWSERVRLLQQSEQLIGGLNEAQISNIPSSVLEDFNELAQAFADGREHKKLNYFFYRRFARADHSRNEGGFKRAENAHRKILLQLVSSISDKGFLPERLKGQQLSPRNRALMAAVLLSEQSKYFNKTDVISVPQCNHIIKNIKLSNDILKTLSWRDIPERDRLLDATKNLVEVMFLKSSPAQYAVELEKKNVLEGLADSMKSAGNTSKVNFFFSRDKGIYDYRKRIFESYESFSKSITEKLTNDAHIGVPAAGGVYDYGAESLNAFKESFKKITEDSISKMDAHELWGIINDGLSFSSKEIEGLNEKELSLLIFAFKTWQKKAQEKKLFFEPARIWGPDRKVVLYEPAQISSLISNHIAVLEASEAKRAVRTAVTVTADPAAGGTGSGGAEELSGPARRAAWDAAIKLGGSGES